MGENDDMRQTEAGGKSDVILKVDGLCVNLYVDGEVLPAIDHLSFEMRSGETLAVVGESGCGKSMTALSIMGLIPQPPARIDGGEIDFQGTDLTKLGMDQLRDYRGNKISMIFQEPMTSLNPVMSCGHQIREGILVHNPKMDKKDADARALEMIKLVGIPAPEKIFSSYPFELSGGMRQRIMIAMALACQPALLICDEPTTALDVTIQAQILKLIDQMREEMNTAVMLITHDMGVVSEMADWVIVMYAGHLVEYTSSAELFTNPAHPYTKGLISSIPSLDTSVDELYAIPGNVPMLNELPEGCPFNPRCANACDLCRSECPSMAPVKGDEGHKVACWMFTDRWGE
ncbi:MAG: ABC transporter ATP-binding protein [Atopobiaceae bacterium]|jgi:peptide/nickel transport system ATP-binding protein/oligopeptide transport system ATP-binding protein|nr:ABC transporter ATP-binding protein [Atopobiaceae bacterium]MCI2173441.1 ABC transporter ATP-binding protein [Atopobiaceae bacterium]MCI2207436.1 ABC transporter ATP-binding protein [Atopobiaceae bacterium]